MRVIELGVREFLDLTLKGAGGRAEFSPPSRALLGTAAHARVTARREEAYQAEVPMRFVFEWQDYRLVLRGRIDGVVPRAGRWVVEEIKSTYQAQEKIQPEQHPFHLAQLRYYHHCECLRRPGERVVPVLTYVHPLTFVERSFTMDWTAYDSCRFVEQLAREFLAREEVRAQWRRIRNASLKILRFPYPMMRRGQQELVDAVEAAIGARRDLLVEAATGIGKTTGVLYPAIRLLAARRGYARIFYLTAKSAGVEIVRSTLAALRAQGLRLRVLYLTAKERCCPYAADVRPECGDEYCRFLEDFSTRAAQITPELLGMEEMTAERIAVVAEREKLCPFELALELSLDADLIVCDYNYVFDPSVYLRRFFLPGLPKNHLFLVDEAHNLPPRSREMYSSGLQESTLLALRQLLGQWQGSLTTCVNALLRNFGLWYDEAEVEGARALRLTALPDELLSWVQSLLEVMSELLLDMPRGETRTRLREIFFELHHFARAAEGVSREYALYVTLERKQAVLHLFCLHPGPLLRQRLERGIATVFFSATLSPDRYFRDLLGAREGGMRLDLPSPFPPEHRLYLHVPDVSTRYLAREATRPSVAQVIAGVAGARRGNYLAFFPSYAYLGAVWAELMLHKPAGIALHAQQPAMTLEQQAEFLRRVCAVGGKQANLGLAVMGGLFGEAVDMPGEQLVGAIIVGPGLPGVGMRQELIREYFDEERNGEGFFYAYTVPGLIRVIQAAGRVFRTPRDRGVVVLLDDRFLEDVYRELLPSDWQADDSGFSTAEYLPVIEQFWESPMPGDD